MGELHARDPLLCPPHTPEGLDRTAADREREAEEQFGSDRGDRCHHRETRTGGPDIRDPSPLETGTPGPVIYRKVARNTG